MINRLNIYHIQVKKPHAVEIHGRACWIRHQLFRKLNMKFIFLKWYKTKRFFASWSLYRCQTSSCLIGATTKKTHDGQWDILFMHYNDVIMGTIASQITSLAIVYSTDYSDADQRKHQSSASLAFVRGIHRGMASNAVNASIWWRHHVCVSNIIHFRLTNGCSWER